MRMFTVILSLLACTCSGSGDAPVPVVPLQPPPTGEGFQLEMTGTAPAGKEAWLCAVYDAPNRDFAYAQRVQYQQNPGTHHMTISSALDASAIGVGPGLYNCEEVYRGRFMEEAIMLFGGQGDAEGELVLPDGIVADLPPGLRIVHEVHFLNTTSQDVELYSRVNVWTIPAAHRTEGIWGGSVRDEHINIPAGAQAHREWSRCRMNKDVDVLFFASHMHARGVEFTIAPWDGEAVGEVFYRNDDWHSPKIMKLDSMMHVKAGEGFEFACHWRNDSDRSVHYGTTAEDEMCNMVVVFTPFDMSAACEVVETSDGVLPP
jgi:hypothetical protein